ncbi:AraC-like DNA-binding protein [Rhodoligotrophos appendicifer]
MATVVHAGLGQPVPQRFIRVGVAAALPGVLRDFGHEPEEIFGAVGIPVEVFDDPDNTIPFAAFAKLIALAARHTGRDDLGLLICEKTSASALGITGFYLQQAPDLRTALNDLVRYLHHHDRGAVPFLAVDDGNVRLGYLIYEPNAEGCNQIYDGAIAIGRNIMRSLCGPEWSPLEVLLSRPAPSSRARYERFFNAPVRFGAEQSALIFEEKWLETKLRDPDVALRNILRKHIELLDLSMGAASSSLSDKVQRLLRVVLLTRAASVDDVCEALQMNRRTLARRLKWEGTSFSELANGIKFEIARQLLLNTSASVTDISLSLHFSEGSAFTRAFRQWSGSAPKKWQNEHCTGSSASAGLGPDVTVPMPPHIPQGEADGAMAAMTSPKA